MTSRNMPKEVFIEDVIEAIVSMAKAQLQNAIFPEYDPVYRIDPKNKSEYNMSHLEFQIALCSTLIFYVFNIIFSWSLVQTEPL